MLDHHGFGLHDRVELYDETVLDLAKLDLDEIAMALSDQTDYEHRWLIEYPDLVQPGRPSVMSAPRVGRSNGCMAKD